VTPLWWFFARLAVPMLPLAALAWWKRIYPGRALVYVALAPGVGALMLLATPELWWPLVVLDWLIVLAATADLLTLPRTKSFSVERTCGRIASIGKPHPVSLTVNNRATHDYTISVRDDAPHELRPDPDEFTLTLAARSRAVLAYEINSTRRGSFTLDGVYVRVSSRLHLWQRMLKYPATTSVNVYPDMKQLSDYARLARKHQLSLSGMRRSRRVGTDNEFERLRDYTVDDNYKNIDWRSTARRRKLTVKDFQANQSQRLVFMIDCGRMMTNEVEQLTLLDHAFNAMLMLSYVALTHGDAVGLLVFSDEIHTFVPPASGMRQMNRLLHASYNRFARLVESRYDEAFVYLGAHCRKRSLVVLMTNLIDEVNSNQVERYLSALAGHHLPLGVMLRDHRLFDAIDNRVPDDDAAMYRAAAAADILSWRLQVLSDLQMKGVLSLDVFPENMTAPLVNRYLEIKARHLL
jgi:uncharacterized protein (DUF58 family)